MPAVVQVQHTLATVTLHRLVITITRTWRSASLTTTTNMTQPMAVPLIQTVQRLRHACVSLSPHKRNTEVGVDSYSGATGYTQLI